jgi:hypothetical protein
MNNDLTKLPAPPKGQTGVTLDQFKHLPPPPKGQVGIHPDQLQSQTPTQPQQQNDLLNNPITRGIQNVFPGKQIGNAVGTSLQGLYQGIKTGSMQPIKEANKENNANLPKVLGDTGQALLTTAAPMIGGGPTALGRIGTNAALGAGLGGTGAVAEGQNAGGVAKSAALGGFIGGGLSAVGETGKYLTENMPKWFTKLALPKLGSQLKGTPQETIDYALNNTKGATLNSMYSNSKQAIGSYENQVQAVLNHPQYADEVGNVANGIKSVQQSFPNAQLNDAKIGNIIKQVAPQSKSIVDRVVEGTANLADQNTLRKELDQATKAAYGDKPNLTFAKQVGKSMADFLRGNVQGTAKETVPIFSEYSKEHALNKALGSALSKKRVAGPLVAGAAGAAGGFARGGITGGITGAAEAIALEEGIRSPTAKLLAAKGIQSAGKVALPVGKALLQGGKAPLIKQLTQ